MKILAIGDIFGKAGRKVTKHYINLLKQQHNIDFIIANGENVTHGKSIKKDHYLELKELGIDVVTSGNHIFKIPEVLDYIDEVEDLLKPMNMNSYTPGKGTLVKIVKGKKIRVTNLIGRSFMEPSDNPYTVFDDIVANDDSDIHIVDFHAEASAEKLAFAWNYDGKITGLFGTHTHVQTADNRLLPHGTAYITDIGMCGSYHSIIGANPSEIIHKEKTGLPVRIQPSLDESELIFSAVMLEIDKSTNRAIKLERIFETIKNQDQLLTCN